MILGSAPPQFEFKVLSNCLVLTMSEYKEWLSGLVNHFLTTATSKPLIKSALKIIAFMELCINNVTVYMYSYS